MRNDDFRTAKQIQEDNVDAALKATLKGSVGLFPGGPMLSELMALKFRDRRIERIEDFLRVVKKILIKGMTLAQLEIEFNDDDLDLIEAGLREVVTQRDSERREHVSHLIAGGILDRDHDIRLGLLELQKGLDDSDIVVLTTLASSGDLYKRLKTKHELLLTEQRRTWNGAIAIEGTPGPYVKMRLSKLHARGLIEHRASVPRPKRVTQGGSTFEYFEAKELARYLKDLDGLTAGSVCATHLGKVLCAKMDPENAENYLKGLRFPGT